MDEWTRVASKSQPGKWYVVHRTSGRTYWLDAALPSGWAWGQLSPEQARAAPHPAAPDGRFWIDLRSGSIQATPPATAGSKRPRDEVDAGRDVVAEMASTTRGPSAPSADSLPVVLQLGIPRDDSSALTRLPLFLQPDGEGARLSVAAHAHTWHISQASATGDAAPADAPASTLSSAACTVRLQAGGSAAYAFLRAGADRVRVLLHAHTDGTDAATSAEMADAPDHSHTRSDEWRLHRSSFVDAGVQAWAVQSVSTGRFLHLVHSMAAPGATSHAAAAPRVHSLTDVTRREGSGGGMGGASSQRWEVEQRDDVSSDASMADVWLAACASDAARPLLIVPVFQCDLSPVLTVPVSPVDAASPTRMLLRYLGVPSMLSVVEAGRGVRARVHRVQLAEDPSNTLIVKTQPFDARVEHEITVMSAVALARVHTPKPGLDALLCPLAVFQDDTNAFFLLKDAGLPLEEVLAKHPPPPATLSHVCCRVLLGVLRAVAALHALGYLHCDVHPGNVLLRRAAVAQRPIERLAAASRSTESETWSDADSTPRKNEHAAAAAIETAVGVLGDSIASFDWDAPTLIDLGSAVTLQRMRSSSSMGATGRAGLEYRGPTRGGKWVYMPPEQFGPGNHATGDVQLFPCTDVYAVAALGAFLLTGEAPFQPVHEGKVTVTATKTHTRRDPALLRMHIQKSLSKASPAMAAATQTQALLDVLGRALHAEPVRRFTDAHDMIVALEAIAW